MTNDEVLVVDGTKREDSAKVLPHTPLLTSQKAEWNDVFLEHYCHPAHETPEFRSTRHIISVSGINSRIEQEIRLEGRFTKFSYGSGEIIELVPAYSSYWVAWDRKAEFSVLSLCPRFLEQVVYESVNGERIELIPQFAVVDPIIQHIALALKADVEAGCTTGQLFGESAATMLAVRLLKAYATRKRSIREYEDGLSDYRLQQAIEYINAYLDQDLKLAELADVAGVSQYYFVRLFKQSMGISPRQYLIRQRVERAKQLLKQRELSIVDIALQCGFANQAHFTKGFRKLTNITPKAYREGMGMFSPVGDTEFRH